MSLLRTLLDRRRPGDDPLLMGVVNVTPDSFSDGGQFVEPDAARRRIDQLIDEGAAIIDIGGESTRPNSQPVAPEEQLRRTGDALQYAANRGVLVSIDTTHPQVADRAAELGASIINDVSCLREGDALAHVARRWDAALIIMHAREPMSRMKGFSVCPDDAYGDVVEDVRKEWSEAARRARGAGLARGDVFFDPGLGFNKNARHSNEIVARLDEFQSLNHNMVVGPSRKSFLTAGVKAEPHRRLGGTVTACLACAARGAAVLRVHDVLEIRQAMAVARSLRLPGWHRGEALHG